MVLKKIFCRYDICLSCPFTSIVCARCVCPSKYLKVHKCVLGELLSRPCPRTPDPSRTPGPDHPTNGPVSVIYRPFKNQVTHTNTHRHITQRPAHTHSAPTYESRHRKMKNRPSHKHTRKDALGQMCTHRRHV